MNRIAPMILLILGIGLAASFGARNGPSHTAWRQASWHHARLAGVHGMETESDDAEETAELQKAKSEALAGLVAAGLLTEGGDLGAAVSAAEAQVPDVPDPNTRLSEWAATGGAGFGFGVLLIGLGAFLARKQQAAEAASGGGEGDLDFPGTVALLVAEVGALVPKADATPMDEDAPALRAAIEKLHIEHIGPLVEGRGSLIAKHGIGTFAEYFGPFSAGERNLNRAWSALTDGHSVVATEALRASVRGFEVAAGNWPKT
ncbi:MAG: hypothetical protein KC912_14945 [Proteobacteria bacterium]|nr:hypothetical protein [Pseudomonadota bacterium]